MKTRKILISGWYGVPNCGDEALLEVFCEQMGKRVPVSVTVLTTSSAGLSERYGGIPVTGVQHGFLVGKRSTFFWLKGRVLPLFKALLGTNLLVIGGGSLLRDAGGRSNLIRILDEIFIAGFIGKTVCTYAVGIGPFIQPASQSLVSRALRYCSLISIRDQKSNQYLSDLTIGKTSVVVVPDPGLLLPPAKTLPCDFDEMLTFHLRAPKRTVFVYPVELDELPSGLSEDEGLKMVSSALSRMARQFDLRFVFVPFQVVGENNDIIIAEKITKIMGERIDSLILRQAPSPRQAVHLVSLPIFNIAIRLHAFIFCVSQKKPVLALNYQHKISNVADEFGLSRCVCEIDTEMPDKLIRQVEDLLEKPHKFKIETEMLVQAKTAVHSLFDQFASLLCDDR
jgi:polysaccharide pyruvyl transferase WcaK-like protein